MNNNQNEIKFQEKKKKVSQISSRTQDRQLKKRIGNILKIAEPEINGFYTFTMQKIK